MQLLYVSGRYTEGDMAAKQAPLCSTFKFVSTSAYDS